MTLPPEIEVTELPDRGVRYRLPGRPIGRLRLIGLVPIAFGAVFAGIALVWTMASARALFGPGGPPAWFGWLFVLFGVPFIVAGVSMAGLGLLILAGRSDVEVRGGRLMAVERVGPVRYARRRPVGAVRRFKVTHNPPEGDAEDGERRSAAPEPEALARLALILAECDRGKPLWVAPGYPRDWLLPLANDLARRCQVVTDTGELTPAPAVEEEVVEVKKDGVVRREVAEQPADSRAVLEEHPDGVTITLPPPGVWRGSKGLFLFALVWCGFMTVFSVLFVPALVAGQVRGNAWIAYVILPIHWSVGIGLLVGAIHLGRRQAALAVVGDRLLVLRTGLFGSRRHEWARADLAGVEVGPSGMTVNNTPVAELQVRPKDGTKVGLLAGRDEAELHWIATRLRRALGLGGEVVRW
jgi:hypothetical protein